MRTESIVRDDWTVQTGEEDLRFPVTGINPLGAASDPTRSTSSGLLYFAGNADNVVTAVAQMPHGWAEGTPIEPHVHLAFPTSAAANTRWKLEYTMANLGGNFDGDIPTAAANAITYAHSDTITVANPENTRKNVYGKFANIDMTGFTVSSIILFRLSRLAGTDGADNDVTACVLTEFDIHYTADRFGKDV